MSKRKLTKKDLKDNPDLKKQGLKEDDEIDIPNQNDNDDFEQHDEDDDTGGSAPPTSKGRG